MSVLDSSEKFPLTSEPNAPRAPRSWGEFTLESLVRLAGFSTIGFVVLIFLFLLREGVPFFIKMPLNAWVAQSWYPTFDKFGTLPLLLGSLLVTLSAVVDRAALGRGDCGVRARGCAAVGARHPQAAHRGAGGHSVGRPGLLRHDAAGARGPRRARRPHRPDRLHRRADPRLHGAAHDHLRGRGRAGLGAEELSRRQPGDGRHPVADDLACRRARGQIGHPDRRRCSAWAAPSARRWRS